MPKVLKSAQSHTPPLPKHPLPGVGETSGIGATICIGQESRCIPYTGFFCHKFFLFFCKFLLFMKFVGSASFLSVCLSAPNQNTHCRRSWRPLVKDCVPNIGLGWHNFPKKGGVFFFSWYCLKARFCSPLKHTLPEINCDDLWSKIAFLILFWDDTIFKAGGRGKFFLSRKLYWISSV